MAQNLTGFIKAYRRLSDRRKQEMGHAYVIACNWLPPPPGIKKFRVEWRCPSLSAEERERIKRSANSERMGLEAA